MKPETQQNTADASRVGSTGGSGVEVECGWCEGGRLHTENGECPFCDNGHVEVSREQLARREIVVDQQILARALLREHHLLREPDSWTCPNK